MSTANILGDITNKQRSFKETTKPSSKIKYKRSKPSKSRKPSNKIKSPASANSSQDYRLSLSSRSPSPAKPAVPKIGKFHSMCRIVGQDPSEAERFLNELRDSSEVLSSRQQKYLKQYDTIEQRIQTEDYDIDGLCPETQQEHDQLLSRMKTSDIENKKYAVRRLFCTLKGNIVNGSDGEFGDERVKIVYKKYLRKPKKEKKRDRKEKEKAGEGVGVKCKKEESVRDGKRKASNKKTKKITLKNEPESDQNKNSKPSKKPSKKAKRVKKPQTSSTPSHSPSSKKVKKSNKPTKPSKSLSKRPKLLKPSEISQQLEAAIQT